MRRALELLVAAAALVLVFLLVRAWREQASSRRPYYPPAEPGPAPHFSQPAPEKLPVIRLDIPPREAPRGDAVPPVPNPPPKS